MGARIRAFDWEKTPLGPISDWAQSIKGTVDLMLASPLAMSLIWGAERVQIYYDAMRALMGTNHPDALGRAGFETWGGREPAEANHRRVFSGESVTLEEYPWTIVRNGWPEETFFTAYLTPLRDETGAVAGELVTAIETASAEALAADLWLALVDPTQIELVILNLALNARDAMPSGGILTLETYNAIIDGASGGPKGPVPGKYVGLTVSDNGIGIPDDVLPHVFEPFFTTKQPGTNSGLGLAQVIGFAKQSGGGIGIETRVGKGTSVRVFLPRAERIWVEHDQISTDSHSSWMKATAKILVVDDDAAVLKTTLRLLDALGYSAIPAASGEEALQLLDSDSEIDLILADLAMPKMSGAVLAKTIKSTHPLPVILVTGYGNREALECFGEARILQKPYTEDELIGKIKVALNER
jgi:CheY-like chemotaxis protein